MNLYASPEFRRSLMFVVNNSPEPYEPKPSLWSTVVGVVTILGFWIGAWALVIGASLFLAKLF